MKQLSLITTIAQDYTETPVSTLIDGYMLDVLDAMRQALGGAVAIYIDDAKILCGILMLFYLSIQAYTLMTGDGKVSILPLIRPFIFFILVINWTTVINLVDIPLNHIDAQAKSKFNDVRGQINQKYQDRLVLQDDVIEAMFQTTEELIQAKETVEESNSGSFGSLLDSATDIIDDIGSFDILESLAKMQMKIGARVQQALEQVVEYIMMMLFKACIYFLYFLRILMQTMLAILGPFVFALSITNAYRDLYLQWISKYVSVGLYGAIAHISIMLAFIIINLGLDTDIRLLTELVDRLNDTSLTEAQRARAQVTAMFSDSGGGITGLVIALGTGIFGLLMTPVIATWILGANSTSQVGSKAVNSVKGMVTGK